MICALRDLLADGDGDPRLVAVGGREAAAVVDHDEVAVAAEPAGVDHGAGRGRGDRRAVRGTEVDPLVHPAPAPAERARDRRAHRPDRAAPDAAWTVECDCAARIFAASSALTCWSESISSASARSCALSEARSAFLRLRASSQAALARQQLVAEHAHLMDADGDDLRLVVHVDRARPSVRAARPRPRPARRGPRRRSAGRGRRRAGCSRARRRSRRSCARRAAPRARRACPPRRRRRAGG